MRDRIAQALKNVVKPARYIGTELNAVKKDHKGKTSVALSYPDAYEIGMSNLGLQILYNLINKKDELVAERFYAPWPDMEAQLVENKVPLFTLETWKPVKDYDIIGFSLQNELTYTNLVNMLKLSGLPLRSSERKNVKPLVIAGGACTSNPYPLIDFIDAFVIGDGEEAVFDIIDTYKETKDKQELLGKLSLVPGVYVPGYNTMKDAGRRIVKDINTIDYPDKPIVPYLEVIHDRAQVEIMRGCPRRCSFCHAGKVNKPVRLLSADRIKDLARKIIANTGYEEISFVSLSSSDYPGLIDIANELGKEFAKKRISISLPSLRADSLKKDMASEIQNVRRSGVTIAPEAGTQRLRDVIHKDLTEEKILDSARTIFSGGANRAKLYFMIGLPTETDEDIEGIASLAEKILKEAKSVNPRARITVNVSTFIPKKETPFENEKMIGLDEIRRRQDILKRAIKNRNIDLKWHDAEMSLIEGAFSTGGQELCAVLESAVNMGARFDNWAEHFKYEIWEKSFGENKVTIR